MTVGGIRKTALDSRYGAGYVKLVNNIMFIPAGTKFSSQTMIYRKC